MKKYLIVIVVLLYLSSYIEVRRSHLLVHRTTFTSDGKGVEVIYSHKIIPADIIGLLQPRLFYASFFAQLLYKPLTLAETMYWYVVEPKDKPWSYTVSYKEQSAMN